MQTTFTNLNIPIDTNPVEVPPEQNPDVNEQPFGNEKIMKGTMNRAYFALKNALIRSEVGNNDLVIENVVIALTASLGITKYFDIGIVCIVDENDKIGTAIS